MPLNLDSYLGVHQDALKLYGQRTEVLATNLANADTPNYRARDVDFKAALAVAGSPDSAVSLATTLTTLSGTGRALVAVVAFSLCSFLSGVAGSFLTLFLARLLMGVAEGPILPVSQSLVAFESAHVKLAGSDLTGVVEFAGF